MKGQNLRITLGGKCVAFATSCTFHVAVQTEDSSTKDDTGNFGKKEPVGVDWDFSCDALYSVEADADGKNGEDALDIVLAQQEVGVEFEQTGGTKNRTAVAGSAKYSGQAIITDISINAPNRQNASYTIQGSGNGALAKSTVGSSSDL